MSEEEIKLIDGFFNKGWCCDLDEVYNTVMKLQDLYNKEKEKNKILDNMLLVNKEQYEFIKNKDKYISEDKIKAMIDKINKDYDDSVDEEGNHTCYYPDYTIDKLQELLEERN